MVCSKVRVPTSIIVRPIFAHKIIGCGPGGWYFICNQIGVWISVGVFALAIFSYTSATMTASYEWIEVRVGIIIASPPTAAVRIVVIAIFRIWIIYSAVIIWTFISIIWVARCSCCRYSIAWAFCVYERNRNPRSICWCRCITRWRIIFLLEFWIQGSEALVGGCLNPWVFD